MKLPLAQADVFMLSYLKQQLMPLSQGDLMLYSFLRWYYCLSIPAAVLLLALISAVYLIIQCRFERSRFLKPAESLLLLIWSAVIVCVTLTGRVPDAVPSEPQLVPFHSFRAVIAGGSLELLRSDFMNIVLFYPAGLFAYGLLPAKWRKPCKIVFLTVFFALASAGIESCQYHYSLGRAEADDVILNALGAFIGACVCSLKPGVKVILSQIRKK